MNKKWPYLLVLIIVLFVGFFLYSHYRIPPSVEFGSLPLFDMEGQPVKFGSLKGKKTVVCFSASWCPPCQQELKAINAIKNSELPDVNIVVISDEPFEKVQEWSAHTGYPFTFLKMDQPFGAIGINSIPVAYLLNAGQEVKKVASGYVDWTDPSTCAHLKKVMEN